MDSEDFRAEYRFTHRVINQVHDKSRNLVLTYPALSKTIQTNRDQKDNLHLSPGDIQINVTKSVMFPNIDPSQKITS